MNKDHAEDTKLIVRHSTSVPVIFGTFLYLFSNDAQLRETWESFLYQELMMKSTQKKKLIKYRANTTRLDFSLGNAKMHYFTYHWTAWENF